MKTKEAILIGFFVLLMLFSVFAGFIMEISNKPDVSTTTSSQTTEQTEAERLEAERLEAERLEAERLEAERLEAETQQLQDQTQELQDQTQQLATASPQSNNQLCSNQPITFCDSSFLDLNQNMICSTSCTTDICCSIIPDDVNNYSENICANIDCPQRTEDLEREHCPNAGNIFNVIVNRNYINNFVINRININGDGIGNLICDPETNINFGALFSFNLFRIPYLYRTGTIDSQDNLISGYPLNYIFVGNNTIFSEFFSTTHDLMDITIDNIFNEDVLQSRRSGIFVKQLQFNLKTNNIVSTNLLFGYIKLTVSNNQPLTILLTIQNGRVYLNKLNDSHNDLINNIQDNELIP